MTLTEQGEIRKGAERAAKAKRITWTGFYVNLVLTIAKLLAGIFGKSAAMVADGVHSLSDFATDIVVLVFIGISAAPGDESHDYGHGKYETFATMIISIALLAVGALIMASSLDIYPAT